MPEPLTATWTVALWGSSQVGKTTTLTAYLGNRPVPWIDKKDAASVKATHEFLVSWNRLKSNQLMEGTVRTAHLELRHIDGHLIRFRDMMGGNTRLSRDPGDDSLALIEADAVLLFVEWPGAATDDRLRPARDALHLIRSDRPVALVITKCEGYLGSEEMKEFARDPIKFADRQPPRIPALLTDLFTDFRRRFPFATGGDIFPVSAFGWHAGQPAIFLDEFGRMVPWNVSPTFVDAPFEFVIEGLKESRGHRA